MSTSLEPCDAMVAGRSSRKMALGMPRGFASAALITGAAALGSALVLLALILEAAAGVEEDTEMRKRKEV
jgi:hypothetical protein